MDERASAATGTAPRPDAPPWSESGLWLLWAFLSCGLLVGVGLLVIGARYRRRDWQRWAILYAVVAAAVFVVMATVERDAEGNNVSGFGWQDVVGPLLWCVLLGGIVHSVLIQARQPRRVAFPPAMVPVTYARPPAWALPPGSYPPPWPYPPVSARPSAAVEPWASFVRSAEGARERFRQCAARVHSGPLREAVLDLAARIDASVDECRRIAAGGRVIAEARVAIDTRTLDVAVRDAVARQVAEPDDPLAASTVAALQAQRATADRMDEVIDDTIDQLRLLDARLGEAVVRVLELSAQAEAALSVPQLSNEVDDLLTELEALRLAVEETHAVDVLGAPLTGGAPPATGQGAPAGLWDEPG